MTDRGRIFIFPRWGWLGLALAIVGGIAVGDLYGTGAGFLTAAAPVALAVIAARHSSEYRHLTQEEALLLIEASRLTGVRFENAARLPRSNRVWRRRLIQGAATFTVMIVIGLALM